MNGKETAAYAVELIQQAPRDRETLNRAGRLLYRVGYKTAAVTAFAEAVKHHPDDPLSRVNLANALREKQEYAAAREHYEAALRGSPDFAEAHQGLSYVLAELGEAELADAHRRRGFAARAVMAQPYTGEGEGIPLLLLISSFGGNIPTRNLIDDSIYAVTAIVPEFYDLRQPLPEHRLIFNAIGDMEVAAESIAAAQALVGDAPVLNRPEKIVPTTRAGNAARLAGLPGVIAAETVTLPRETLLSRTDLRFPLLLRSPGFHTGRYFVKVETPADLPSAAAELPGAELTAIEYLDARGKDGKSRKYRAMMIDGEIYPLHLAISSDWKIHYFTAEMAHVAENRAEDEAFLNDMPRVLGPRAMAALRHIQNAMGLDYAGIDFGLSPDGDVLLFEANATMVVNPPEPAPKWDYRRPAVERIFAAVRSMLSRNVRT